MNQVTGAGCTVAGDKLDASGAAICVVQAFKAGDINYIETSTDTITVTVTAKPVPPAAAPVNKTPTVPTAVNGQTQEVLPGIAVVLLDGKPAVSTREVVADATKVQLTQGTTVIAIGHTDTTPQVTNVDSAGVIHMVQQGTTNVSVSGFDPGSDVYVWMMSTPTLFGQGVVSSTGAFVGNFPVPSNIALGNHTIQIVGMNPDKKVVTGAVGVIVEAPALKAVMGLTGNVVDSTINLSWTNTNSDVTIVLTGSDGSTSTQRISKGTLAATISNLSYGVAYSITVTPVGGAANLSSTIVLSTQPETPQNIQVSQSGTNLTITWNASAGATQYRVAVIAAGSNPMTVITNTNKAVVPVKVGTTYQIIIVGLGTGSLVSKQAATTATISLVPVKPTTKPVVKGKVTVKIIKITPAKKVVKPTTKPSAKPSSLPSAAKTPVAKPSAKPTAVATQENPTTDVNTKTPVVGSSSSIYFKAKQYLLDSTLKAQLRVVAKGLSSGDSVSCVGYALSRNANKWGIYLVRGQAINSCAYLKSLVPGLKTTATYKYIGLAPASAGSNDPSRYYRVDLVISKR